MNRSGLSGRFGLCFLGVQRGRIRMFPRISILVRLDEGTLCRIIVLC